MRTGQKLAKSGRIDRESVAEVGERFHHRGRGAISNQTGRFEHETREALDDGWGAIEEAAPPLRTTLTKETPRTIITFNKSPDIHFDRSINPYRVRAWLCLLFRAPDACLSRALCGSRF